MVSSLKFLIVSCSLVALSFAAPHDALSQSAPMTPLELPTDSKTKNLSESMSDLFNSLRDVEEPDAGVTASLEKRIADNAIDSSLGNFGVSMMYQKEDIDNVERILGVYEASIIPRTSVAEDGSVSQEDDILSELLRSMTNGDEEALAIEEDTTPLPNYYLGTIMYRRPGDWAVWVNGERYDSATNSEYKNTLRVVGISRELVTFAWTPENSAKVYKLFQDRQNPNLSENNHRHAHGSYVDFAKEENYFTITMRSNQTFLGDEMDIVEGRMTRSSGSVDAASLMNTLTDSVTTSEGGANESTATPPVGTLSNEERISQELIQNMEKLQRITPVPSRPQPAQ